MYYASAFWTSIANFFKDELFKIGNFSVTGWMVVALGALLLCLFIIILCVCIRKRKTKKKKKEETRELEEIPSQEEEKAEKVLILSEEEKPLEIKEEPEVKEEEEKEMEKKAEKKTEKKVVKKETKKEAVKTAPAKAKKEEAVKVDDGKKEIANKNYHVSLREDGKWQVKFAKGERALKVFDTQAEAIEFAKEKAVNQKGSITIHKKDGKIRKQKY